ncbi:YdcH family protein [Marimonas sp. MJW-29]|uniref:YdcH family protein n=1 Tax=Sulfitobacter sediminis TaxID=3234186 RepID=A0ABV3RM72_9RHOB
MALNAHLETLKRKHQEMSEAVERAQRSPGIDDLEVATMKKEKLRLKEEIARLSS